MEKTQIILIVLIQFIFLTSCAQGNMYDLKDYKEVKRGAIEVGGMLNSNTILYKSLIDSAYTAKVTFWDSLYKDTLTKFFYYHNVEDGPAESFVDGRLFIKGAFKKGKADGDRFIYGPKYIRNKAHWKEGIKVGTWEYFSDDGKLIMKVVFDNKGNIKEEVKYQ